MGGRLTKAERATVRGLYDGRCAYCGAELQDRWHADHLEPVIRNDWLGDAPPSRPHNHRIDNMRPACPQCNISKGSMSLETWREWLAGHLNSLNRHHSIYRLAKAYGLVMETGATVQFYFESAALRGSNDGRGDNG